MLTWNELVKLEPGLQQLEEDISTVKSRPNFCANRVWYREFKPRLGKLVGYSRPLPGWPIPGLRARDVSADVYFRFRDTLIEETGPLAVLYSPEAYDVAYSELYDMLPNCSHPSTVECG